MAKITAEQNDALFMRLTAMRVQNPKAYAIVRIRSKWDELNSHFEKNGKDEIFLEIKAELNSTIKKFKSVVSLREITTNDETLVINRKTGETKVYHGYNFNYTCSH